MSRDDEGSGLPLPGATVRKLHKWIETPDGRGGTVRTRLVGAILRTDHKQVHVSVLRGRYAGHTHYQPAMARIEVYAPGSDRGTGFAVRSDELRALHEAIGRAIEIVEAEHHNDAVARDARRKGRAA
jgi:hypothetical protein